MTRNLVVLGAGGFAREAYWHIQGTYAEARVAFVDDVTETREVVMGETVVPVVKDWAFGDIAGLCFDEFIVGVGDPVAKRTLVARALASGLRPAATVIHPRALVQGSDCRIGVGGIVTPGCVVTTNVTLGDFVLLNLNCTVGHDAVLGDYVTCNPGCQISGCVTIGAGASLGTGTVVREKVRIAEGVITGAQAGVVKSIDEPNVTIVGLPARKLG